MENSDGIKNIINDPKSLVKLSSAEAARVEELYPTLPDDYLRFMREIGHGNLGNIIIYAAPMDPGKIYPNVRTDALQGLILFGDDMQGYCYGFDLRDAGRVVEIDPRGMIDRTIEPGFMDFLKSFLV